MSTRITVNNTTYDSLDAMPPDVRRMYDEMMAKMPATASNNAETPPVVFHAGAGPLHITTTVRRNFVMNGKSYSSEQEMPPDVRATYEQAMGAAKSDDPTVRKNAIKVTFRVDGPSFSIGKSHGEPATPAAHPLAALVPEPTESSPTPQPIEPDPLGGRLNVAVVLAVCVAAACVAFWFMTRAQ